MRSDRSTQFTWIAVLALAAAVAGVYGNSLRGPFVLDDISVVTDNASIRDLRHLGRVLTPPGNGAPVQGRPVANLTIAINFAIGGERVVGYHVGGILLHFLNCVLLFALVRRTLALRAMNAELAARSGAIALVAALLWAVHPLASAAVDYISQRTELLACFFYLLTLYLVLLGATAESARRRLVFDIAAVVACMLGMASKEVMATAPVVVLMFERIFVNSPWRTWLRRRGPTYVALCCTWLLLAILVTHSGTRGGTAGLVAGVSPWRYLLTQCNALLIYLKLSFWPDPLIFDYGPGVAGGLSDVWRQAVVVMALLVGSGLLLWRYPRAGFLAAAWLLILAPSSSVIPVRTQTIAEHRAYLPLAIVMIGTVAALAMMTRRLKIAMPAAGLAVWMIVLGALTVRRNTAYATDVGLWRDALAKRPDNPRAYLNIAVLDYVHRHDYAAAIDYFTEALRRDPDFTEALVNRCSLYLLIGNAPGGLADADRLVKLKPREAQAYLSRAAAWEAVGQNQRQIQDATSAIGLDPHRSDAYYDRGNGYMALKQYPMAIADYTQAIRLNPREAHPYFNRANAELYMDRYDEAVRDYDRTVTLAPNWPDPYLDRGIAHAAQRQHELAIADFTRAAELNPTWSEPYLDRAASHAAMGQYEQAWGDVRECRKRGGKPHPEFIRTLTAASGGAE